MTQLFPVRWCLYVCIPQVWSTYSPVKNNPEDALAKVEAGGPSHSATSGELDIYQVNCRRVPKLQSMHACHSQDLVASAAQHLIPALSPSLAGGHQDPDQKGLAIMTVCRSCCSCWSHRPAHVGESYNIHGDFDVQWQQLMHMLVVSSD